MNVVIDDKSSPRRRALWGGLRLALLGVVAMVMVLVVIHSSVFRRPGEFYGKRHLEIAMLKTSLSAFELDNGRYPTTAEGLAALLKCPAGLESTWIGPYAAAFPMDEWGHPFFYRCPGVTDPTSYDLVSAGADRVLGTEDDIEGNGVFDPEGTRPDEQAG